MRKSGLPQDGHIRVSIQGKPADLRVSVIPTIHGEKAVLRFLNTDTVIDSPETFGMSEENYGKVLDILKRPNGIFYITGPTGIRQDDDALYDPGETGGASGEHCGH